jgi:hypothetical protein
MNIRVMSALAALAPTVSALANETVFDCNVLPATSSVVQTTDATSPFAGTLIGDYDATNNPTGTRTIPGFFGGSGNNPINYTASFALAGDINSHPLGSLVIGVDPEILQIRISGLDLDMLGAVPGTLAATLNINYQTFHTQQPNAIFPGGINIPLPVGNGSVTTLRAVQTSDATGVLAPQKNGSFDFAVAVPVDISTVATLLGQQVLDGTPTPAVLPLTGNIVVTGNSVTISFSASNQTTTTQPITGGTFSNLALAIPTVIPTGSTANVLMSGEVTSVSLGTTLNVGLSVAGQRQAILGDLNSDYSVNFDDLSILLSNWGGSGASDLNQDGVVSGRDVTILLNNWQ